MVLHEFHSAAQPALPISFRLPEEGALTPHAMGPRPHTMASPRILLTSQAPPALREWEVESPTSLKNYLLVCVLTCSSLSFLETEMGLPFCWGGTLWKAERGHGETRGKGAERWLSQTCSGWVFGKREESKLLSFYVVNQIPGQRRRDKV